MSETSPTPPPASDASGGLKKRRRALVASLVTVGALILVAAVGILLWRPWVTPVTPSTSVATKTTPSISATPKPTVTPTPTPGPVTLVLSATGLEVRNLGGDTVWSATLLENPTGVINELTSIFGSAPVVTDLSAEERSTYQASYKWDGVTLITERPGWDVAGSILTSYTVHFFADHQGPVSLTTPENVSVGQPESAVAPFAGPSTVETTTLTCHLLEVDPTTGTTDPATAMFDGRFLDACVDRATGVVSSIMAPSYLFLDT